MRELSVYSSQGEAVREYYLKNVFEIGVGPDYLTWLQDEWGVVFNPQSWTFEFDRHMDYTLFLIRFS